MKKTALILAAVAGLASTATAQNWNLGNLSVTDVIQGIDLNGAAVTPGTYNNVQVSLDWVAGGGNPWSNEAIWALTDADFSGGAGTPVFHSDPGASPDSLLSGDPVTLTWNVALDVDYSGGDPLWFNTLQTFAGSDATWNNVSITLSNMTNPPPSVFIDLGVQGVAGSFDINTGGSGFDTELGLFNMDGDLIASNDDAIGLQSQVIENLAEGMYYIATSEFNTTFGNGFNVTGGFDGGDDANLVLNINGSEVANMTQGLDNGNNVQWFKFTVVPTPATTGLLAFGGLVAARRRR